MTELQKFCKNIRFLAEIQHISQEQLADSADITTTHLNRILCGNVPNVSFRICSQLASALGRQLTDLLVDPREFMLSYEETGAVA